MSAPLGWLRHRGVRRPAQVALGAVFGLAALAKIGDLAGFALQVHNYRLAPVWSEHLLALTLPWIELVVAVALVVAVRARAAAVIALGLMVLFTVAVAAAWARGLDFECGCFGKAVASTIGAHKFLENCGLCVLALVAALPRAAPSEGPPALP